MKNMRIAYIGGGSKAWAQILMKDLLLQNQLMGEVKLFDIDSQAAKKNQILLSKLAKHKEAKSQWKISVYNDLESVLKGSEFVVLSILPGTFEDMDIDVHYAEKYGIYQSVGDTVGPGGYRRALRLFKAYETIAKAIRDYAPEAWVINYTNPMTLSLKVLYSIFPKIKAVGCCHEVFGTQKLLAKAYQAVCGFDDEIDRHEIHVNVQGINHFTWIDEASYKGENILPYYKEFVEKHLHTGNSSKGQTVTEKAISYFDSMDKVKMDLYNRYNVVAAAGDRHLAEFMPSDYLVDPNEVRDKWAFDLTPVSWRMENNQTLLINRDKIINGEMDMELSSSDEEGANIMIALAGIKPFVTNANYPNVGQAPDLPLGSIVETNISFSGNMAKPIVAGPMTEAVRELVINHVQTQDAFTKAYLLKDIDGLKMAFYSDQAVSRLESGVAEKLFNEIMI